jgi:hypothetical protein
MKNVLLALAVVAGVLGGWGARYLLDEHPTAESRRAQHAAYLKLCDGDEVIATGHRAVH